MKVKLPNQTEGDVRVTTAGEEHVFPVASDGTVETPELLAYHLLLSIDGAEVISGDQSEQDSGGTVDIPSDLDIDDERDEI